MWSLFKKNFDIFWNELFIVFIKESIESFKILLEDLKYYVQDIASDNQRYWVYYLIVHLVLGLILLFKAIAFSLILSPLIVMCIILFLHNDIKILIIN